MLKELVAAGHAVAGCGRNAGHIETLRREYPAPHRFASVDVSDDVQVSNWAVHILNIVGIPDLLINNAAVVNTNSPLWEIQASEFDGLTSVNIKGVANVIRHFVPAMVKVNRGVIVNFSSGWGRSTSAGVAAYCATKWVIEGLTKALAQDLPKGMAAVPLNPGIIDTDMLRTSFGNAAGTYESPERWAVRAVRKILALILSSVQVETNDPWPCGQAAQP
ncbi:MAG: SDR family oxidoreductase [Dechloromonas sp.]|nr:SDR family oxidoreductase [Candidatus Dechloromonas phosphoritropha]